MYYFLNINDAKNFIPLHISSILANIFYKFIILNCCKIAINI